MEMFTSGEKREEALLALAKSHASLEAAKMLVPGEKREEALLDLTQNQKKLF